MPLLLLLLEEELLLAVLVGAGGVGLGLAGVRGGGNPPAGGYGAAVSRLCRLWPCM